MGNLGSSKIAGIDPHGGIDEEQFREAVHELSARGIFPEIFTIKIFVDSTHQMMGERTFQSGSDYLYARQFIEKIRGILEEEGRRRMSGRAGHIFICQDGGEKADKPRADSYCQYFTRAYRACRQTSARHKVSGGN